MPFKGFIVWITCLELGSCVATTLLNDSAASHLFLLKTGWNAALVQLLCDQPRCLFKGAGNNEVMSVWIRDFTTVLLFILHSPSLWRVYSPLASGFAVKGKLLTCHFIPLCSQLWCTPFPVVVASTFSLPSHITLLLIYLMAMFTGALKPFISKHFAWWEKEVCGV